MGGHYPDRRGACVYHCDVAGEGVDAPVADGHTRRRRRSDLHQRRIDGSWELPFTAMKAFCAYRGLASYPFRGIAWRLHTAWDIVHHLTGHPIIPF